MGRLTEPQFLVPPRANTTHSGAAKTFAPVRARAQNDGTLQGASSSVCCQNWCVIARIDSKHWLICRDFYGRYWARTSDPSLSIVPRPLSPFLPVWQYFYVRR